MEQFAILVLLGFFLDLLLGDPPWPCHPIRLMGQLIASLEAPLRKMFPATPEGERQAGTLLTVTVVTISTLTSWALLWLCGLISPYLAWALELLLCALLLATKSLYKESMAVYACLNRQDLSASRLAVGRIVGRDTGKLEERGVAAATVETVAENFSDGVLAPLLFILVAGVPGGMCYKAINTLDSMVGYQNDRFLHYGRTSAKLDDLANFLPARIAGLLLAISAPLVGLSGKNALKIYIRDRKNHKSPNSAHTEAAVAGALGVQLGGDNFYGGISVKKPTIGDDTRPLVPEDIPKTNQLMLVSALVFLLLIGGILLVGLL